MDYRKFIPDLSRFSGLGDRLGLKNPRPPYEGAYIYLLLFFFGYLAADFSVTMLRGKMLPKGNLSAPAVKKVVKQQQRKKAPVFTSIKEKNIFNADHVIAEALGQQVSEDKKTGDAKPVPSSLSLTLVGTITSTLLRVTVDRVRILGRSPIYMVASSVSQTTTKSPHPTHSSGNQAPYDAALVLIKLIIALCKTN